MFKKKEKTEKAPKNKKVRTMKVGTHKKSVLLLWAVLLASTSFGVYKNFTAIDTHTVHEKEIIQLRLNDTNGIENFVKNFAKAYYSWDTSKEAIEARTTEISKYLTKELQDLNADTIRTDIPTSVTVTNVLVWNVEQSGMNDFTVAYEVDQQVKEGEQTQAVTENYTVTVHVDKDGAMVITQNPTLAPAVQKSKYEPKVQEADVSVSSDTVKDATAFLETFFKLYPTATEKELPDHEDECPDKASHHLPQSSHDQSASGDLFYKVWNLAFRSCVTSSFPLKRKIKLFEYGSSVESFSGFVNVSPTLPWHISHCDRHSIQRIVPVATSRSFSVNRC